MMHAAAARAAIFSQLALLAAGEWTRRLERISGFSGLPTAHIPSILTAAGTTVPLASVADIVPALAVNKARPCTKSRRDIFPFS